MFALETNKRTHTRGSAPRLTAGIAALLAAAWLLQPLSASAKPGKTPTPPTTPGNFHVTAVTTNSVSFAWKASSPGSSGSFVYEIFNDTTGLILNVGTVTSYTWTEVEAGDTYSFHIIAIAGSVASAPSPEVTVTLPAPPPPTAPSTPGDFHVTAVTTNSVSFAWNASTPGSGGSLVYVIENDTQGFIDNVGNVTNVTWTVGVEAGGTYSFHINAVSGNEESAPSPEVTVTLAGTPLPTPVQPDPPVITEAIATSDTLTVSWTEATPADEISDYAVLVNGMGQLGDGGGFTNSTTFTASNLWPGYTYTITVVAYSLNGTTGALTTTSEPVTVTTEATTNTPPANAPTAPTGLNGGGDGGGEAIISWNPSTSVNEPQADIQYNIYIDGVWDSFDSSTAQQGTLGQTENIYIFPRGADVPAEVWVVAVDQFGNQSAPSNILTVDGF